MHLGEGGGGVVLSGAHASTDRETPARDKTRKESLISSPLFFFFGFLIAEVPA
jgi:hypothetical protein